MPTKRTTPIQTPPITEGQRLQATLNMGDQGTGPGTIGSILLAPEDLYAVLKHAMSDPMGPSIEYLRANLGDIVLKRLYLAMKHSFETRAQSIPHDETQRVRYKEPIRPGWAPAQDGTIWT